MPDGFKIKAAPESSVALAETQPILEMSKGLSDIPADPPLPSLRPVENPARAPESNQDETVSIRDIPSEADKKDFMRKVFAGKRYQRMYKLYGGAMTILFEDRSTLETEMMYDLLDSEKHETEDEFATQLERYLLALQFRNLDVKGEQQPISLPALDVSESPAAQHDALKQRVDKILQFPKPTYLALMEANRRFEDHVRYLTDRALNTDFWKAGGGA
jgi:hypothetical protein